MSAVPVAAAGAAAAGATALLDWTSSGNGEFALDHGTHCAAALLPRDDDVVLVVGVYAMTRFID